jgi:predicted nucleotidyltransferase
MRMSEKAVTERETEIISDIIETLSSLPVVESARLYGSRARGDATSKSDFDIAIAAPMATRAEWLQLLDNLEQIETLLDISCVRLEETSGEFRERIINEGKVIYERREDPAKPD